MRKCVCSREKASFTNAPTVNFSNRIVAEHEQASELHNGNGGILDVPPRIVVASQLPAFFT
jgi:hypothetical protein